MALDLQAPAGSEPATLETLAAANAALAAELAAVKAELEALAYSISHDLRAPLRGIDGFSQALEEEYGPVLAGNGLDYLQRVRAASQRITTQIDGLLSLSRLGRAELRPARVDLTALADDVAAELRAAQPGRTVTFERPAALTAYGDLQLLRTLLEQLLGNAWKFTGRRTDARVELGQAADGQPPAYFVRDNGAGFDMAYSQRLFGAFQRLHDPKDFPGTGLGLAIVQRIVNRHGGRVWAEGRPDAGATIYFTLGHSDER
ncbi:MAG: ATP-binding protein [Anaerolineales bacterium]